MQLQRLAGNRAISAVLASPAVPSVQRAVSPSASWSPAGTEAGLIQQVDAKIPLAEAAAARAVKKATGTKTARQANYIQAPSPRTWGYVVEEKLDAELAGTAWSTQHRLLGARPDYFQRSNGIEVYVDLTTASQAGIGGNHITEKLDNAGFLSPDNTVAAADVSHRNLNPRGTAGSAIVLGKATLDQVRALQQYRRFTKRYIGKQVEIDFNPGLDKIFNRYGDITHKKFTRDWKGSQRRKFADRVLKATSAPHHNFKKRTYNTRSWANRAGVV